MKVLWFVNAPFTGDEIGRHITGGRGGWLSNLAGLVRDDIDLHVVCVDPYSIGPVRAGNITTYYLKPSHFRWRLLLQSITNIRLLREFPLTQLLDLIQKLSPDLIHIFGTEKGYIEILAHQSKYSAPVAVSLQGIMTNYERFFSGGYDRWFLSKYWYDIGGKKSSLFPKRHLSAWNFARNQAIRERKFLKHAKNVDGRTSYDMYATQVLAPNANYFHVDRALRCVFFQYRWQLGQRATTILHTTLSDNLAKGFDMIAEVAIYLRELGVDFMWRIAGITQQANSVLAAKKLLGKRFPDGCFEYLGGLSAPELASSLVQSSIFVLPTYCENSPNSLAEAQVVGVPCVSTNVGGVATYLSHNEDGLLAPPGDPISLTGMILELIRDPQKAARFSESARLKALERHNSVRVRKQLLSMYDRMLEPPHRPNNSGPSSAGNSNC